MTGSSGRGDEVLVDGEVPHHLRDRHVEGFLAEFFLALVEVGLDESHAGGEAILPMISLATSIVSVGSTATTLALLPSPPPRQTPVPDPTSRTRGAGARAAIASE